MKLGVVSVAKSFTIDMWLARHTPEKVLPILHKVVASVKEEFADAVANGDGIYAVGYCFGARYVLLLGSEQSQYGMENLKSPPTEGQAEEGKAFAGQGPLIKAGALAHGTQISKADMAGVKVPVYVVAVEDDALFPDEVRDEGQKAMEERGLDHELKVYSGVPHGFAVLGDYEDARIVEKQKEAFGQMLGWLRGH